MMFHWKFIFTGNQSSLDKQSSLQSQLPSDTMTALCNNTHSNSTGENRKISFVIQDDNVGRDESKTASQTTLALQVIRASISLEFFRIVNIYRIVFVAFSGTRFGIFKLFFVYLSKLMSLFKKKLALFYLQPFYKSAKMN